MTDPREGIERSLRHALDGLGVAWPAELDVGACIGPPLEHTFGDLLGTHDARIPEAVRLYRERYNRTGWLENCVYPGSESLLAGFRSRGWRAYVVTSKPSRVAEQILRHFALAEHIDGIFGPTPPEVETKAALIERLLRGEPVSRSQCVMVGDRRFDVEGASAHDIPAIGVTYGYGSRAELERAGARWLCDDAMAVLLRLDMHWAAAPT